VHHILQGHKNEVYPTKINANAAQHSTGCKIEVQAGSFYLVLTGSIKYIEPVVHSRLPAGYVSQHLRTVCSSSSGNNASAIGVKSHKYTK
jgi:hypothetical protein